MTEKRLCKTCNTKKSTNDFYKSYKSRCKSCCVLKQGEWSLKNPDKCKKYKQKFSTEKSERYKEQKHQYYLRNKGKSNKNSIEWAKRNRDRINKRIKERKLVDVGFRILEQMRSRTWHALKGMAKSDTTKNLLGCSLEDFKKYIESLFLEGMYWDNYGKWHVDHIKPCSLFNLTNESEQKECFHYTNLQPLWARDNLRKYNKTTL